ncbi:MAG TPA: ATP-dependent DNA helicase [Stackebrandtia sp.]|uniref:ATP-dependent helicase n=1 Tax=Stackebrandtia sp. TaxID=2023065 RepID=UPI002D3B6AB7|nr:ATP-dependent DNA helicase [Stackebrandtia sp.]HZE40566.1 ATP-dependent DNA helicase [Stackebrandtia sp.]
MARPGYEEPGGRGFVPDAAQARVIGHRRGPLLVHGGPGTGKTTVLIESIAARVAEGAAPSDVLVLAFGRRGAATLRRRITARLEITGAEVPVFSFPAYAFAVLRAAAARRGEPPPQLLKGPEQDVIIRELLGADTVAWPETVRPALGTHAFAAQLRDLLLRATERGISAPRLAALGRMHDRPEWISAADFMAKYVDVLALRSLTGGATYDSAEIVRAAASELRDDPELIDRPTYVYVDELQDTDPAHIELLSLVAGHGANLVALGDADSATFGFRGGDATVMREFADRFATATGDTAPVVDLDVCHRSAREPLEVAARVAKRLRGTDRHRRRGARPEVGAGAVEATILRSVTQQAAYIARQLRAAHVRDEVPWSRMAVIVKSAGEQLPVIERALRHSGVPVHIDAVDQPLSTQPVVRNLLAIIQCGLNPKLLDEETAVTLLQSAYGGADALTERKLRQELRAQAVAADVFRPAGELLVEALRDPAELTALPEAPWADPPRRIAELMECARDAKGTVEDVVWAVWERSGLSGHLARRAVSRDSRAAGADTDLDAMMTLFEWAADFTDRLPGSGADAFAAHVLEQVLPADTRAAHARRGEVVRLLTAHSAKGRQWDLVVVAGVQEGRWPNLRPRGSLMGSEDLVEAVRNGVASDLDTMSVLLDEERRLFYVALTRAADRLIVTAVADAEDNQPSRFIEDLDIPLARPGKLDRPLTLPWLVADLRRVACGPSGRRKDAAIAQLSRLAAAGVPGADPAEWWGLRPLSDDRPLALPGERVRVTPSTVELAEQCGLRWMLERHGGTEPSGISQEIGNLVHAAAEEAAYQPDPREAMRRFISEHLTRLPSEAPWKARQDSERVGSMVNKLADWLESNTRELLAAEQRFSVTLPDGPRAVTTDLVGAVDRLERDLNGGLHIVDIKTGKNAVSAADAQEHPQLASYQVAVESGAFAEHGTTPAGASLVYPGTTSKSAPVREQPALPDADDPGWARRQVLTVAETMASSTFDAVHTKKCDTCAVKQCCPISSQGRSVTR